MASMAAFVYFWSSAYEVSGGCATDTLYPSFLRILATASQPEPSANAPCTKTTFLICSFMTILLFLLFFTRNSVFNPSFIEHEVRYNDSVCSFGRPRSCTIHAPI